MMVTVVSSTFFETSLVSYDTSHGGKRRKQSPLLSSCLNSPKATSLSRITAFNSSKLARNAIDPKVVKNQDFKSLKLLARARGPS